MTGLVQFIRRGLTEQWRKRIAYGLLVVAIAAMFWWQTTDEHHTAATLAAQQAERRHDNCVRDQKLYDGQFVFARYLADEFHATPEQLASGLERLHRKIDPRPVCPQPRSSK